MKKQNERAIGEKFITLYYNDHHATNFTYKGRPAEAPDLTYVDGVNELNIEIGTSYYDDADARIQWETARGSSGAGHLWRGVDFDEQMVGNINALIERKCGKDYGRRCILVVHVRPKLTTIEDMRKLLDHVKLPSRRPFDGIYLSGDFADGYSCWRIDARYS